MKNIIVIGGGSVSQNIIDDVKKAHRDAIICHRGNLNDFDNELQSKLLRAIEDAEKSEIVKEEVKENFIINSLPIYDIPIFLTEKKGKHNSKSKTKYLWKS